MSHFSKHPLETYPIGIDYAGKAPTGAVLLSGVWSAYNLNEVVDATADVLANTTAVIDGMVAKVRVKSGTLNQKYRLSLAASFDTGDVLHDNVYMTIMDDG